MAKYGCCPTCNEWAWLPHACKPWWEWRSEDDGEDDWRRIHARDAQEAAECAAEKYDEDDCCYLVRDPGRNTVTIYVRNPETREVSRWRCSGELIPQYRARAIVSEDAVDG